MPYEPIIGVGPKVPTEDLDLNAQGDNNRWGAVVKYNEEYKDIIRWLGSQCSRLPADVMLIAQNFTGDITSDADGEPVTPTLIQFGTGPDAYRHYAALVGLFPHVARVELINHFGGGDPSRVVMYPGSPVPPLPDGQPSPVGERWPEMDSRVGGKAYRPSDDNPMAKPYKAGDVVNGFRLTFVRVTFSDCAVWVKVA